MTAVKVRGIDNVLLSVGDLGAAIDFYAGSLGFPIVFRLDERGIALLRLGDEHPGLLVQRGPVAGPQEGRPRLWLEVADARSTASTLAALGVAVLTDPFPVYTGWTVEVADPWGNIIGFTDYTTKPEHGRAAGV